MEDALIVSNLKKKRVALFSFLVTLSLTFFKGLVGFFTGSLAIIADALHSAVDLIATGFSYIAVKISSKPADENHNFGHGKIENLSALFESALLFLTCIWISWEAIERLLTQQTHFVVSIYSYIVVIVAIVVDINRSTALYKAAKKYRSQALEADAYHFFTDILTSSVVLLGLILSNFGIYAADSIGALVIVVVILFLSYRLARKAVDQLIDKAPSRAKVIVEDVVGKFPEIKEVHNIKIRMSGADIFVNLNIHLDPNLTLEEAHRISDLVEEEISKNLKGSIVHIHQEPSTEH